MLGAFALSGTNLSGTSGSSSSDPAFLCGTCIKKQHKATSEREPVYTSKAAHAGAHLPDEDVRGINYAPIFP